MAINFEQLALMTGDKFTKAAIESLLGEYMLLSLIPFDNSATASGDAALNYVYSRVTKLSGAAERALNEDFVDSATELKKVVAELKALGGNYKIDNAIRGTNNAASVVEYQQNQKIKATIRAFFKKLIGDIDKVLLGSEFTKQIIETTLNVSDALTESTAEDLISLMDELCSRAKLKNGNGFIAANTKTLLKLKAAARKAGYLTQTENAFGVTAEFYNGVPLIDLEDIDGEDIIPVDGVDGTTGIYGVRLALDATHGVASQNPEGLFKVTPPDFDAASANGKSVAYGLVQMVTAFAFKSADCIAKIEGLKVQ